MHLGDPDSNFGRSGDSEDVLILDPPPDRVLGRGHSNRIGNHPPRLPIVPRQLDAVRRADVRRVSARDDAVRRDVLPFRTKLPELPVLPRLAAVGREPPAVADRPVPDLAARSEAERMHEIPRDRMCGGVARGAYLLPAPR